MNLMLLAAEAAREPMTWPMAVALVGCTFGVALMIWAANR